MERGKRGFSFTQSLLKDGGPNDGGDGWASLTTSIIPKPIFILPYLVGLFL
ncbi:Hypothetical protein FKW44_010214 [Caligus rogercresseyi]|uniref:Uncharacterized protein n=1 Tax=Caligus rogercresseyi TaxID=217165 RepID=A0A7T8K769_CALRO|nr:Hypothetical protein FKW44_010214 [Caligus rogercresseyi]